MTFTTYEKPKLKDSRSARLQYLPRANTLPIFLLPGILGFQKDVKPLAEKLFLQSKQQRPIFIFNDNRNELSATKHSDFSEKINLSLAQQAKHIKEGVITELHSFLSENVTVPIAMAAFSYNAPVAMLAIDQLIHEFPNARVTLYVIDGCTPKCAAKFLSSNSVDLNQNIIDIVNYACQNAGFINTIPNDNAQIETLLTKQLLTEKLFYLENLAKQLNDFTEETSSHDQFNTFMAIIKNDLHELCKKENATIELDETTTIKLLSIQKTKTQYQDPRLGWPDHTKLVLQKKLSNALHTQLLSEIYVKTIAKDIHKTMQKIEHDEIQKSLIEAYQSQDDSDESSDECYVEPNDDKIILDDEIPEILFSPSETSENLLDNASSTSSTDDSAEVSTLEFSSPAITAKSSLATPSESGDNTPTLDPAQLYQRLQKEVGLKVGYNGHGFFKVENNPAYLTTSTTTAPIPIPKQVAR